MNDDQNKTNDIESEKDAIQQENSDSAFLNSLFSKIKNFLSGKDPISDSYPKDLTPEDIIALFDLQPEDIPAMIVEEFPGIPPHIKVLNEVHLDHASPEDYFSSKKDEQDSPDSAK